MGQNQGKTTKMEKKEMKLMKKLQKLNKEKLNHQVKDKKKKKKNRKNRAEEYVEEKADFEIMDKNDNIVDDSAVSAGFANPNYSDKLDKGDEDKHYDSRSIHEYDNSLHSQDQFNENVDFNTEAYTVAEVVAQRTSLTDSNGSEHSSVAKDTEGTKARDHGVVAGRRSLNDSHDSEHSCVSKASEVTKEIGEYHLLDATDLNELNDGDNTSDDDTNTSLKATVEEDTTSLQDSTINMSSSSRLKDHLLVKDSTQQSVENAKEVDKDGMKPSSTEIVRHSYMNKLPELYKLELHESLMQHTIPQWYRRSQESWRSQEEPGMWSSRSDHRRLQFSGELKTGIRSKVSNRQTFDTEEENPAFNSSLGKVPSKVVFNLNKTVQNTSSSNSGSFSDTDNSVDFYGNSRSKELETNVRDRYLHDAQHAQTGQNRRKENSSPRNKERKTTQDLKSSARQLKPLKNEYQKSTFNMRDNQPTRGGSSKSGTTDRNGRSGGTVSQTQPRSASSTLENQDIEKAYLTFCINYYALMSFNWEKHFKISNV